MLFNINELIKFINKYTTNFKLIQSPKTTRALQTLILKSGMNKKYLNTIDIFMNYINQNKLPSFIKNSLRMTCV